MCYFLTEYADARILRCRSVPLRIGDIKHQIRQPLSERRIVVELLKNLHIVLHDAKNSIFKGVVAFHTGVLLIRIF